MTFAMNTESLSQPAIEKNNQKTQFNIRTYDSPNAFPQYCIEYKAMVKHLKTANKPFKSTSSIQNMNSSYGQFNEIHSVQLWILIKTSF